MNTNIYLDNAATTTARPEVIDVMVPLLAGGYNPSSAHAQGREARAALSQRAGPELVRGEVNALRRVDAAVDRHELPLWLERRSVRPS